jgi:hypothetical protein
VDQPSPGGGAAEHWADVAWLRAAVTTAMDTSFKDALAAAGGGDTDVKVALVRLEQPLVALEVALKTTKVQFDGLDKRLQDLHKVKLAEDAEALQRDVAARREAGLATAEQHRLEEDAVAAADEAGRVPRAAGGM